LIDEITGNPPTMPKEGDALTEKEVRLIARWIQEGAHDNSPEARQESEVPAVYHAEPILSAISYSPDGRWLAVAAFREVILIDAATYSRKARLVGKASRIEAIRFSPDGSRLAAAGGSPGEFGEVQIWDVTTCARYRTFKAGTDSIYSVDWSPDQSRLVFGGADKTVRVWSAEEGRELIKFDQNTDWVFGTGFLHDGRRLVSASRDKSLKLIEAETGALLDVLNRDSEPIRCMVVHPKEDSVVFGTDVRPRMYRAAAKADNTDPNQDPNQLREFEHFDSGVTALAFSPDGHWLASTGSPGGEVRIHDATNSQRKAVLRTGAGLMLGLSFSSDGERLAAAGSDGKIRVFEWMKERLITNFVPVEVVRGTEVGQHRQE
jgi:WD40 repeat protein